MGNYRSDLTDCDMECRPTTFQAGKLDNVIHEMINMNVDIMGLGETRWTCNGKIIHEDHVLLLLCSGGERP